MNISIDKGKMKGEEDQEERVMGSKGRRLCVAGTLGPCQMSLVRQTLRTSRILFDTRGRVGGVQVDSIRGAEDDEGRSG